MATRCLLRECLLRFRLGLRVQGLERRTLLSEGQPAEAALQRWGLGTLARAKEEALFVQCGASGCGSLPGAGNVGAWSALCGASLETSKPRSETR